MSPLQDQTRGQRWWGGGKRDRGEGRERIGKEKSGEEDYGEEGYGRRVMERRVMERRVMEKRVMGGGLLERVTERRAMAIHHNTNPSSVLY